MLGRTVGIVAACALGANAFILPPGIAPASNGDNNNVFPSIANPKERLITIPCPECAFPLTSHGAEEKTEDDDFFWIQGGANSLVLNFTVSGDNDLLLSGNAIDGANRITAQSTLYVQQVPSSASEVEIASGDVRSANLRVTDIGIVKKGDSVITETGDSLAGLKVQIFGVEMVPVSTGEVEVKMLRTSDGELLILSVESHAYPMPEFWDAPPPPPPFDEDLPDLLRLPPPPSPFPFEESEMDEVPPPPPPPPHHRPHRPHDKHCDSLPAPLCRLKNMFDRLRHGGFRKMGGRPCPGRKGNTTHLPSHIRPLFGPPGPPGPERHHGRPHHMRPHGPHHGHHHPGHHGHFRHSFMHAFVRGLVAVLIPVIAGITVGITVSLLGLIVGRLIGFLWITLVRGGRRGTANSAQQEVIVEEGEGKAMLAEMEAPPVYEEAPAYEEVTMEEK